MCVCVCACVCVCVCAPAQTLSHVWLSVTPWTVAHWAPWSMGFSRRECWSRLPLPPPGDLPDPGIEHKSPVLAGGFFTSEPPGKPTDCDPSIFFFKDFLMWTIFKVFIELVTVLPLFYAFWFSDHKACWILAPWPMVEPVPPILEGEILTTGPPILEGKVLTTSLGIINQCFSWLY